MVRVLMTAVLVLSGCWVTEGEIREKVDNPPDFSDDLPPLVFSGVEPSFGSTAGGNEVVVQVGPLFDAPPEVRIGGVMATVLDSTDESITVSVPPRSVPAVVDVEISADGRDIASNQAYTYYQDQSGLFTSIGTLSYYEHVGDEWGNQLERPEDFGVGWVFFMEPSPTSYYDLSFGASMESCNRDYTYNGSALTSAGLGASSVTFTTGSQSLSLPYNTAEGLYERELSIAQYRPGSNFALEPLDSIAVPSFVVEDMVKTPLAFQVTSPDFTSFSATVGSSFDVAWTTAEQGDYVVIRVDLYDNLLGEFVETVRCVANDDGYFRVDRSNFTQWEALFQTAVIWVGRVMESDAVLPHDNSASGMVGIYWVIGLAATDL